MLSLGEPMFITKKIIIIIVFSFQIIKIFGRNLNNFWKMDNLEQNWLDFGYCRNQNLDHWWSGIFYNFSKSKIRMATVHNFVTNWLLNGNKILLQVKKIFNWIEHIGQLLALCGTALPCLMWRLLLPKTWFFPQKIIPPIWGWWNRVHVRCKLQGTLVRSYIFNSMVC